MGKLKVADNDFSTWIGWAENSPETFESMRLQAINDYIESVPKENRERLRRLQWRLDQERRLAHTPMAACLAISRMMWDNVLGDGGLRDRLEDLVASFGGEAVEKPSLEKECKILQFSAVAD